jgi:hypothetical protein
VSQYLYEKFWSDDAQLAVKKDIAHLLDNNNLLLLTGAGFSNNFGYPMWGKFLNDLNAKIGNPVDPNDKICKTNETLDYLKYAQEIDKKFKEDSNGKYDLINIIYTTFNPDKFETKEVFYKNLLQLGFQGFITLNYDTSLEQLIQQFQLSQQLVNPINVCNKESKIEVKKFLDNITEKKEIFSNILHLHGIFKEPNNIILTQSSYDDWYHKGSLAEIQSLTEQITTSIEKYNDPTTTLKVSELFTRIRIMFGSGTLNSDHKKLIWLIFARYRILFLGFSANDSYFMNLLDIVKDDLVLPRTPVHYIFEKYNPTKSENEKEEKERSCERLIKKGLWPVFYPVIDNNYERGLESIVRELESLKTEKQDGIIHPCSPPHQKTPVLSRRSITEITDEMMELR